MGHIELISIKSIELVYIDWLDSLIIKDERVSINNIPDAILDNLYRKKLMPVISVVFFNGVETFIKKTLKGITRGVLSY